MPYYTSEPRIMAPMTFSKANHIFLLFLMLNGLCAAIEDASSPSPFEGAASPQALALRCSAAVPMPSLLNMGAHAGRGDNNNAKPHKKAPRRMPRLLPVDDHVLYFSGGKDHDTTLTILKMRPSSRHVKNMHIQQSFFAAADDRSLSSLLRITPPAGLLLDEAKTGLALRAPDETMPSATDLILEGMDSALERVTKDNVELVFKPWLNDRRMASVKKALEDVPGSRLDVDFATLVNRLSPKNDNFRSFVIKALAHIPAHRFTPTFIEMVEFYSFTQDGSVLDGYSVASFIDALGKFEPTHLGTVGLALTSKKESLLSLPPIERDRLLNRLHEIFVMRELPSTKREQSLRKSRNTALLALPNTEREEFFVELVDVFLKNAIEMDAPDAIAAEIDRTLASPKSLALVHSR